MKKTILFAATISIIAALSLTSCKKSDVKVPQNNTADLEKVQAFFDTHKPKYESHSLDAAAGGTITLSSGTKLTFPPNAFKNGSTTVTGNVTITALDILKPSSMILGDKPTITNDGQMLESFGEIIVRANQNGNELQLNNNANGKPAVVPVALAVGLGGDGQRRDLPIWDGDTTITLTSQGHNHENQLITLTTVVPAKKGMEWTQIPGMFGNASSTTSYFNLDALGEWRNIDVLYADPRPKTTVLGFFGNHFNATNANYMGQEPSMLFFKTKGTNTLVKLYNVIFNPAAGKEGLLSYQNMMPIGQEGTFLAISTKDGKFYAEMRDVTVPSPDAGKNYVAYTFNFSEVSETQLLNLINQMNTK